MAQASLEWVVSIICATVVNRTFVKVAGYCLFDVGRELLLSVTCSFHEILLVNFGALYLNYNERSKKLSFRLLKSVNRFSASKMASTEGPLRVYILPYFATP